jgi:hypothetical protein
MAYLKLIKAFFKTKTLFYAHASFPFFVPPDFYSHQNWNVEQVL